MNGSCGSFIKCLLIVNLSIIVFELGNSTGSSINVAIRGSKYSSGASSKLIYKNSHFPNSINIKSFLKNTYLLFLSLRFHLFKLQNKFFKIFFKLLIKINILFWTIKNLDSFIDSLILIASLISNDILFKSLQHTHIAIHSYYIDQKFFRFEIKSFWIFYFKL